MLLGNAYFNNWRGTDVAGGGMYRPDTIYDLKEKSIEHYCKASDLEPAYIDQVEERFQEPSGTLANLSLVL